MATVPEAYHDLFDKRTIAHLVTLLPDGMPHVTPVWVDYDVDTGHLLVNTARGRPKERNAATDPRVDLSMCDPADAYRYLSVRGRVVETTESGAVEYIDRLARRYMDVEEYPNKGEEAGARVVLHIEPGTVLTGE
jgi:PPOX class probable F420-dependent enzyme